ncbi:Bug family tripartite tricarboxylate transporter substrate binding protein [Cupriavidus plantarum]|uniref:Tripartite-type tricarboxylate transporter receptor subunit TctC n=1 Tax=Cupriavidus plantarum TaxID=942865 RepID=A0A316EZA1_9BURK|nr:tripartite tricarboxylate transporter substrate binding protein [Cupriavidus plantarum]PWK37701.1 tripartite-type tricarboxylate transporter receptor subunit TctC [Cupriavidus plantarum]
MTMRPVVPSKALLSATLLASTMIAFSGTAAAQDAKSWPNSTISIVSGFPGGAATDIYARKLGVELNKEFGVSFISDNRPGAGGNIASALVAQAKPDGYTFLLGTAGTHAINPALYSKLQFDVVNDFSRIALLGTLPNILLINPEKHPEIKTCADLLNAARKAPGTLNYASTGNGASGHLAGTQFATASKTSYVHIPYKGQGPAMTALLSGEVDFFFNQSSPSLGPIQSGKVRALAVTSPQRVSVLPDVPTVAEACNLPGFESTTWYGLFGPANLPADIQNRMSKAVLKAINTDSFKEWLVSQAIQPIKDGGPEAFKRVQQADMKTWAKIVKDSGAHVD